MTDSAQPPVQIPDNIRRMMEKPGLYIAHNPGNTREIAPLYVDTNGVVWSMKLDEALSPDRWLQTPTVLHGPLTPKSPEL